MGERRWAIIVHGGAKTIESARAEANRAGCRDAVEVGAAILREGGSAIDVTPAMKVAPRSVSTPTDAPLVPCT